LSILNLALGLLLEPKVEFFALELRLYLTDESIRNCLPFGLLVMLLKSLNM